MTNYLLLRNNKESGPYSIDELLKLGLKAYDLIWVQGKSAAWRYPSEVDELKPYAPAAEEQPYDRFFRKPEAAPEKKEVAETATLIAVPAPVVSQEQEKYLPRKAVFVTMPQSQPAFSHVEEKTAKAVFVRPTEQPLKQETVQPTIAVSEKVTSAEVKFSQPLDDIKDMYLKNFNDRKQKAARQTRLVLMLRRVAVVALLVALGVLAGFWMRPSSGETSTVAAVRQPNQPANTAPIQLSTPAENSSQPGQVDDAANGDQPSGVTQGKPLAPPTGGYVNPVEKIARPRNSESKLGGSLPDKGSESAQALKTDNHPGVETDSRTGERSRSVRTGESSESPVAGPNPTLEKATSNMELAGQVHVSSNDYKKTAFGGIRDLQLTVTNSSRFALDDVVVELQYLRPNETPLRTENVKFHAIGPGETSTLRIPDTNRGIKVSYRVIHISSRQADPSVAGKK